MVVDRSSDPNTAATANDPVTTTQSARFRMILLQEFRLLLAERTLWIAGTLFVLLIGYALYNGVVQTSARDIAQAAIQQSDATNRALQLTRLQRIMSGTEPGTPFGNPANPEHMGGSFGARHVWMPSAPLAPVALGQSDLYPSQFKVGYQSKVSFIHNDDIENPWNLLSGHFDLAFVVVYLLPLLIFVLSYNLLSGERESGTLRLLMSQPVALQTLIGGKVVARSAVLLGIAVLVPTVVLLFARPMATVEAGASVLWWMLIVASYALFWFALVVAVNALGKSSATNAMLLVIAWVVVVLIAPVLLGLGIQLASPAPSRAELAGHIRTVTAAAMAQNAELMATDYTHVGRPEVLVPRDGKITLAGRAMASYRIQRQVDAEIEPELRRFDAQHAQQQRLVAHYSLLSPAAVAYEGMTALAGSGQRRQNHFMQQLDHYHVAWKQFFFSRIDAGLAITPADFSAMPQYVWQEEAPQLISDMALRSILQIFVPGVLLLLWSAWKLRRYQVA